MNLDVLLGQRPAYGADGAAAGGVLTQLQRVHSCRRSDFKGEKQTSRRMRAGGRIAFPTKEVNGHAGVLIFQ